MFKIKGSWPFWLVVTLALIPRAAHLLTTASNPLGADSVEYDALAWQLATGAGYISTSDSPLLFSPAGQPTAFRTPGFPLYAAALYKLVGHQPLVVRASLALLNAVAAGALFAVGGRFGRRVGWIAGIAWAFWPAAIYTYWAADAFLAEALGVPLLVLFVWWMDKSPRYQSLVLAGMLLGWAQLTRSYFVLLIPTCVLLVLVGSSKPRASAIRQLLVVGIASALPLVVWGARNFAVFGQPVPLSTQAGVSLWVGNNRAARGSGDALWYKAPLLQEFLREEPQLLTATEPEKSALFVKGTILEIREGGARWFAWLLMRKLGLFFYPFDVTYGFLAWLVPCLILLPFGCVLAWNQPTGLTATSLLGCVLMILIATVSNYHDSRYRYTAEPFMIVLAAIAADAAVRRIFSRRARVTAREP